MKSEKDHAEKNASKTRGASKIKAKAGIIKKHRTVRFWFIGVVFALFLVTALITAFVFLLFRQIRIFDHILFNSALLTIAIAMACVIIGTALSVVTSNHILIKIKTISDGMKEISKGNFKTRVPETDREDTPSEFGELERSFNQMAADLDGIEMFRNDFINNFSHEFKTPIVSIRGFARQLQGGNLSPETQKEYIDIIASESERLSNMSSNILLLTKLENQQIVSEKTDFYLDEQIRKCILLLEKEWSRKNIELDLDNLNEIKNNFNEEMLSQMWINLISNAIKFTPENGKITFSLEENENEVIFTIKDNGIGMDEEVKSRIFEKFYQGDKSHNGSGNGIGLNIVARIVALAKGDIKVESQPGNGSCFTVTLPR